MARALCTTARWLIAAVCACAMVVLLVSANPAWADESSSTSTSTAELQQEVERTSAEYEAAKNRVTELQAQIDNTEQQISTLQKEIDDLNASITAQEEKTNHALVELYKLQQRNYGVTDIMMNAETISDFIDSVSYMERISNGYQTELNRLVEQKAQLSEKQTQLDTDEQQLEEARDEATAEAEAAQQALEAAVAAREEAARKAALASGTTLVADNVDWSVDKTEFVNEWAARIDAYLAGTPMAGTGVYFASAAWDYGVDPRWSPAITKIESSNGRYCIKPYNAWGWGAADSNPYGLAFSWNSWEEAIYAHVRGLVNGYGYTITPAAAQKYCPSNWELWYQVTCSDMNRI